jgi:hypothetical protein
MSGYGDVPKGEPLVAQFYARKMGGYSFELHPELWALPEIATYYSAKAWIATRFTNPPAITIPAQSGIYMFVVAPHCGHLEEHSYIFYVGKTNDLHRRYGDYLEEQKGRGPNPRQEVVLFLDHLRDYVFFHYTLVPELELDEAEKLLKDNLTPPANSQVKVVGRLDAAVEI